MLVVITSPPLRRKSGSSGEAISVLELLDFKWLVVLTPERLKASYKLNSRILYFELVSFQTTCQSFAVVFKCKGLGVLFDISVLFPFPFTSQPNILSLRNLLSALIKIIRDSNWWLFRDSVALMTTRHLLTISLLLFSSGREVVSAGRMCEKLNSELFPRCSSVIDQTVRLPRDMDPKHVWRRRSNGGTI